MLSSFKKQFNELAIDAYLHDFCLIKLIRAKKTEQERNIVELSTARLVVHFSDEASILVRELELLRSGKHTQVKTAY